MNDQSISRYDYNPAANVKVQHKVNNKLKFLLIVLVIIFVGGISSIFFFKPSTDIKGASSSSSSFKDGDKYFDKLKKLIYIDPNETLVSIKQVQNVDKLKEQNPELYKYSVNGDVLFIFKNKIIIFRDTENKIISFVPIINK